MNWPPIGAQKRKRTGLEDGKIMRDNISVIAGKIAILVLAGILSAQSAVLAAGPEPKKPAIKEAPAKSTKPAPPGSNRKSSVERPAR